MPEPVLDWHRLAAGMRFPPATCVLDAAFVDAYLESTGEAHPLYAQGYAPPLALTLVCFTKASLGGRWPDGTLQRTQQVQSLRALRRGERIELGLHVGTLETADGKSRLTLLTTATDERGAVVARHAAELLWAHATAARGGAAGDRGAARPPSTDSATDAERIGPLTDRYPIERLRAYGAIAGARDPIHLDPAFARSTPLGVNVVQGKLVATLLSRLMLEHLGLPWLERGFLEIRFRRPVRVDEPVTAGAERIAGASQWSVWCANPAGEHAIAGAAGLAD